MASRVADILIREGENAARAREQAGILYGGAVAGLGQVPSQIQAAETAAKDRAIRQQLQGQQLEMGQRQLEGMRRQDAVDAIIGATPHDEQGMIDLDKASEMAGKQNPALVPHVRQLGQKLNTASVDYQEAVGKAEAIKADRLGDVGLQLMQAPTDVGSFHVSVGKLGEKGLLSRDEANQLALASEKDPTVIAKTAQQWIQGSPKARAATAPKLENLAPSHTLVETRPGEAPRAVFTAPAAPIVADKGTPEQQYLHALTSGDKEGAQRILTSIRETAKAKQDPGMASLAGELGRMRLDEAKARLEKLKDEAPASDKNQQKLEQEYRGVLTRELSSRSGGLGMEDQKVNQAVHLLALMDQYEGKPMPAQIHGELALGLARLTSPSGQVGIELEREFKQKTAQEGVSKAVAYLTGDPTLVNATPEKLRAMLRESITRQGKVAESNRSGYFDAMRAMAPTDLSPDRRKKLEQSLKLNTLGTAAGGLPPGVTVTKEP